MVLYRLVNIDSDQRHGLFILCLMQFCCYMCRGMCASAMYICICEGQFFDILIRGTGEWSLLVRRRSPGMRNAVLIGIRNESILSCESTMRSVAIESVWGNGELFGEMRLNCESELPWFGSEPNHEPD